MTAYSLLAPVIGLFIALICIQLFFDALFFFICYSTGVTILYAIKLSSSKYQFLSYQEFKSQFKNKSHFLAPTSIGFVIWTVILIMTVVIIH